MNAGGVALMALPAICRLFWLTSLRSSFRSADRLSLPGLARQSIDARVKPAHDEKDGSRVRRHYIGSKARIASTARAVARGCWRSRCMVRLWPCARLGLMLFNSYPFIFLF